MADLPKGAGPPPASPPPRSTSRPTPGQPPRRASLDSLPLLPASAPVDARGMASLLQWDRVEREQELPDDLFVALSGLASVHGEKPLTLLPEIKALVELQQALPSPLQGLHAEALTAQISSEGTLVEYPFEAITPKLQSKVPFAEALKIADHPGMWATSTPQMKTVEDHALPSNGSLWRWSLTKRTDFGMPLLNGLSAQETIHITAEGSTSTDGKRGWRRYSYVLASSAPDPRLLRVVKDTGWIELSGDENGIHLRVKKQANILRPPDDPYAAILSAGFGAELWLWAMGFFEAAGADSRPQLRLPLKPLPQRTQAIAPPAAGASFHVAVLGGGPAGLACAWLLSNPSSPDDGAPAWGPRNGGKLPLKVTLVEKCCVPGGKAASGRRMDQEAHRVQEHGLHVLMGCYTNVLEIIRWTGNQATLLEFGRTHLPGVDAQGLDGMWTLDLGPWPTATDVESLQQWGQKVGLNDWQVFSQIPRATLETSLPTALQFGEAAKESRPVLRSFAEVGKRIVGLRPDPTALPRTTQGFNLMVSQWLTGRLMKSEVGKTAFLLQGAPAPAASNLPAMASLLRDSARAALPADSADEGVAMLREWVELATTVVVGLEAEGLFPYWALDNPKKLLQVDYDIWVRGMQALDGQSLQAWLELHGILAGFVPNSRVLAALTASLFTTPAEIAAGTFLHGMARLLLTYEGAPYRRMVGGTGEAFVAPIFQHLRSKPQTEFEFHPGTVVESLVPAADGRIVSAEACQEQQCDPNDFSDWVGGRWGWRVPPNASSTKTPRSVAADAYVLAIPPYAGILPGVPAPLAASLVKIASRATIGLQCWSQGAPHHPDGIISAMPGPLRCVAAMSGLEEGPGFGVPVYACGDVEDDVAGQWGAGNQPRDAWLASYRAMLQQGALSGHEPYQKVNHQGSERYTCADVDTQAARRLVYDTGVANLWLAGDWTRSALSCGSIEAAVTSGLEAARDILDQLGCEVNFPIVGAISKEAP